jgi:hypothetical protein
MTARRKFAALLGGTILAGCTEIPPPAPNPPIFAAPPPARVPEPEPDRTVMRPVPAPPPIRDPPLRPVDPDPPALQFPQFVSPLTPPDDATDCTGWWRICHFY